VVGVTVYLATDLAAVSLDAPAVVGSQTWVSLVWTVTNTGPGGASSGFVDSVYLETNGNVVSTLNYGHGPVPPGSTATFTNRILFPSVAEGSYTLALKVDSQQYVFGNNGLNSTLTGIPITVLNPDLQPTALQVTGPGVSGLPMQFVWTVANNGSSPAGDVGCGLGRGHRLFGRLGPRVAIFWRPYQPDARHVHHLHQLSLSAPGSRRRLLCDSVCEPKWSCV
jgi:subtilase family serine protease